MDMKCGRWILLLMCMLLFTACRVTVNVDTDDTAGAAAREDEQESPGGNKDSAAVSGNTDDIGSGGSSAQNSGKDDAQNPGQDNAQNSGQDKNQDTEQGEGQNPGHEAQDQGSDPESAQPEGTGSQDAEQAEPLDKEHTPIPDYDPTPLPGYESIVFIGDSRTLTMAEGGTYEFRLVPEDSVEATWGGVLTDDTAFQNARLAARKHRDKAVFWYGINDVQLNPQRNDQNVFINNYLKVIDAYLSIEPDSTIYIISVLDTTVREKDYYQGQEQNIRNYNQALYRLCLDRGWYYVDVTSLLIGDECYAEGDNIHFSKAWYQERFLPFVTVFTGLNVYQ